MRLKAIFITILMVLTISLAVSGQHKIESVKYTPIHVYDPGRNAETDIKDAIAEAQKTKKRILLEVGGKWCIWCRTMDGFFEKTPELTTFRDEKYIMVKINYSPENENKDVLSHYPAVAGYPHIFILDENGKLLHSQDTGELESGKSYDLEKFFAFLKKWSAS